MELRSLFLALLWLVVAPLPETGTSSGWTPPVQKDQSVAQMLDHAHSPAQRLHERWMPDVAQHWQRSREIAVDMICDLGVMALALVDCPSFAAAGAAMTTDAPAASGGGLVSPDFNDIRRRSIEERMHSI